MNLNPTKGSEIHKVRPCVVVSSDSIASLRVRVVVPITEWQPSHVRDFFRVRIDPDSQNGLDKPSGADAMQIRTVAEERFTVKRGVMDPQQLLDVVSAVALVIECP